MAAGRYGLLGAGFSGSDSTYYSDYAWANSSNNRVAIYGGDTNDGSKCGAFACDLCNALSISYWGSGASPSSNRHWKEKVRDPKWVPDIFIVADIPVLSSAVHQFQLPLAAPPQALD